MMKNPELKPCPFCGSKAELYEENIFSTKYSRVRCKKCYAETEKVCISLDYAANNRAVELWNRRVTDD